MNAFWVGLPAPEGFAGTRAPGECRSVAIPPRAYQPVRRLHARLAAACAATRSIDRFPIQISSLAEMWRIFFANPGHPSERRVALRKRACSEPGRYRGKRVGSKYAAGTLARPGEDQATGRFPCRRTSVLESCGTHIPARIAFKKAKKPPSAQQIVVF